MSTKTTFFIHTHSLVRWHQHHNPISLVGYVCETFDEVKRKPKGLDVSLLLSGEGTLTTSEGEWELKAPCGFVKTPGMSVSLEKRGEWRELLFQYPRKSNEYFKDIGIIPEDTPVWHISNIESILPTWELIEDALFKSESLWQADRIDRLCDLIIVESHEGNSESEIDQDKKLIFEIRDELAEKYMQNIDIDELVANSGMKPSTFRNRWKKYIGMTPSSYLGRLRIQRATRLLSETDKSIGEIASLCGFENQLYFSRRFKQFQKMNPSDYRKRHGVVNK